MINFIMETLKSIKNLPLYLRQLISFRKEYVGRLSIFPILYDYGSAAGIAGGHYFHQDLLVASYIFKKNPKIHVDLGSRIDGFVAHVASFREINLYDIRDIEIPAHPNIKFTRENIFERNNNSPVVDSISSLHAIEHFGLGRYGDPIDPNGHIKALDAFAEMLAKDGRLYLSVPIGMEYQVCFNAHRIFRPEDIPDLVETKLKLIQFDYVDDAGDLHKSADMRKAIDVNYGCGIYTFEKL